MRSKLRLILIDNQREQRGVFYSTIVETFLCLSGQIVVLSEESSLVIPDLLQLSHDLVQFFSKSFRTFVCSKITDLLFLVLLEFGFASVCHTCLYLDISVGQTESADNMPIG